MYSRFLEEEKKEEDRTSPRAGLIEVGNCSVPGRKDYELRRPTPFTASTHEGNGDSGAVTCSAVMTSLSKSLKRNLSINTSTNSISSHNLPSLPKTLKRNLSKGSQRMHRAHPNETFPTFNGMEERVERASLLNRDGRVISHRAKRVTSAGSATPSPVYMLDYPNCSILNFQPNQVILVPNQAPQIFSGVGSVLSSESAPIRECDKKKEESGSTSQVTSKSIFPKMSSSEIHSKKEVNASCVFNSEKEKESTSTNQAQQQEKDLCMTRVLAVHLCAKQHSEKLGGDEKPSQLVETCPDQFYKTILSQLGYRNDSISSLQLKSYFLEYSQDQIAAYDHAVTGAVRSNDLDALRRLFLNGKTMQCSNKFGESIVHMACRKGSLSIIHFLLEEAGVSLRVRDDFGRTPLHDACWASTPSFEAIRMLIQKEPDLLLLADRRGNTPLAYVRDEEWGTWCQFLDSARDVLAPKSLVTPKAEE